MNQVKPVFDISSVVQKLFESLTASVSLDTIEKVSRYPENIASHIYGGKYFYGQKEVETPGLLGLYRDEESNPLCGDDTMGLIDPFVALSGPGIGYAAGIAYERLGESDIMSASAEASGYRDIMIPISGYVWAVALSLIGAREESREERRE